MTFPAIQGPDDPGVYSWTVDLDSEQELVQLDDRTAGVYYESGHRAVLITAVAAHDASGADVPTSLEVIEPDVISLTVHHKAGDPAAGGAPFDYPISSGAGWEGGFVTHVLQLPPGSAPVVEARCVVPKLAFRTLAAARTRLEHAGCRLGKVRGDRSRSARVVKQFRTPGTELAGGARVAVKLG